jgi:hypothetical protein
LLKKKKRNHDICEKLKDLIPVHGPKNKVGFVDSHGKVVISFQFYDAEFFMKACPLPQKSMPLGI